LKWFKADNTFQWQENGLDLWVMSESKNPLQITVKHKSLMQKEGIIQALEPIHKEIVQQGVDYFLSIKDNSLAAAKFRWTVSNRNVQEREPLTIRTLNWLRIALLHIVISS